MTTPQTDINAILEQRGSQYGKFQGHARLTQAMYRAFVLNSKSHAELTDSMMEAIHMIFHKLGRIGNGDPFYLDSWVDIVGYTQLVVNELQEIQQKNQQYR